MPRQPTQASRIKGNGSSSLWSNTAKTVVLIAACFMVMQVTKLKPSYSRSAMVVNGTAANQEQAIPLFKKQLACSKPILSATSNLSTFIDAVFHGLNQVVVGQRPIEYISEHYDTLQDTIPNGNWIEFGVYTGHTLRTAHRKLKASKKFNGKLFGFDSFEGLPSDWRGPYQEGVFKTDYHQVRANMPAEICLYKGWFQDTIPTYIQQHHPQQQPLAFVHHDGDLFVSTTITFQLLGRLIQPGTLMCFDELVGYSGFDKHEILALYLWMHQYHAKLCPVAFLEAYPKEAQSGEPEMGGMSQNACFQVVKMD
ncbi:expressed unknown protein [Seminavis robusta]|uniref:Uncharacterized protein n=1 Tax=Seminavis robusta TaxID=568900 RepID=A0A9N8DSX7_9STRA|nr:expressed unknown protein [Seminavis robusta]|eukprot:Sro348_g123140.1 n/a (310) ;mRNA; f:5451-6380